jgi:hypothetical protein
MAYEVAEDNLMKRKPRNSATDRLTNGRLFCLGYTVLGLLETVVGYLIFFELFKDFGFSQELLRGVGGDFDKSNNEICGADCCPLWFAPFETFHLN